MALYNDDVLRLRASFPTGSGDDAGELLVRDPSGAVTTYTADDLVIDRPGDYHYDLRLTRSGAWRAQWYLADALTPPISFVVAKGIRP
jgi:hypothetical protein